PALLSRLPLGREARAAHARLSLGCFSVALRFGCSSCTPWRPHLHPVHTVICTPFTATGCGSCTPFILTGCICFTPFTPSGRMTTGCGSCTPWHVEVVDDGTAISA